MDPDPAILDRYCVGNLAFEVKVLLPAERKTSVQNMRRAINRCPNTPRARFPAQVHGSTEILGLRVRNPGTEHGG